MNKLILCLLISIVVCINKLEIKEKDLIPVKSVISKSDEEITNDIYFTICINLIGSKEYEEAIKDFLDEFPDDVTNIEVGFEICKKLSEMDEFQQLIEEMKDKKSTIKLLYDYDSNYKKNKMLFPKKDLLISDKLEPSFEKLDMESDIILKGLFSKGFWKKLFNAVVTVVELLCLACVPVCEGVRAVGNVLFDELLKE